MGMVNQRILQMLVGPYVSINQQRLPLVCHSQIDAVEYLGVRALLFSHRKLKRVRVVRAFKDLKTGFWDLLF